MPWLLGWSWEADRWAILPLTGLVKRALHRKWRWSGQGGRKKTRRNWFLRIKEESIVRVFILFMPFYTSGYEMPKKCHDQGPLDSVIPSQWWLHIWAISEAVSTAWFSGLNSECVILSNKVLVFLSLYLQGTLRGNPIKILQLFRQNTLCLSKLKIVQ